MHTPLDAAPSVTKRTRLVEQAMEQLDEIEELPADEQLRQLGQTADLLAGVLRGDDVNQLGIPGVG